MLCEKILQGECYITSDDQQKEIKPLVVKKISSIKVKLLLVHEKPNTTEQ